MAFDSKTLRVVNIPSQQQSYSNRAIVNILDFDDSVEYVNIISKTNSTVISVDKDDSVDQGCIGLNALFRDTEQISCSSYVVVKPFNFKHKANIDSISFSVELLGNYNKIEEYRAECFIKYLKENYLKYVFKVNRKIVFKMKQQKTVVLTVISVSFHSPNISEGFLDDESKINFSDDSCTVKIVGGNNCHIPAVINPNWNFKQLGVGGLNSEVNRIIRRTFYTRMLPVELVDQLKIKHTKGILLYGPPGTGKTLLAREIGKMLNARHVEIISGPQLLNKYVGESEANVRYLFEKAEKEFQEKGNYSQLHVVVIDEIDAICKQRGSSSVSSNINDNIVNQLLAKIDGMVYLNNLIIIGMTNRRNLLDDALLRPGRLEVQIEINLPDKEGRLEIFQIHTDLLFKHNKVASDVILEELADETSNYSGAEIEGIVRAAITLAIKRLINQEISIQDFIVERNDFCLALKNDVISAYGNQKFSTECNSPIIHWSPETNQILNECKIIIQHSRESRTITVLLLEGRQYSGKTTLARRIANDPRFSFVNELELNGSRDSLTAINHLSKLFNDSYRFQSSCIIIDDIERLLDEGPQVWRSLQFFLKHDPPESCHLMVICTTSEIKKLPNLDIFTLIIHVPSIGKEHLKMFLQHCDYNIFTDEQIIAIYNEVRNIDFSIGCKKLVKLLQITKHIDKAERVKYFSNKLAFEFQLKR